MSTINDGGPAFPYEQHQTQDGTWNQTTERGMSLRDYFAASALKGMEIPNGGGYSDNDHERGNPKYEAAWISRQAYCIADAMLAASEVQP